MNIFFVCTGNTCRSAMAEGIFKHILKNECISERFYVTSAGIAANEGEPATDKAMDVLQNLWGIDISTHKSHHIKEADLDSADLILVMTRDHRMILAGRHQFYAKKIFTIKQYSDDKNIAYKKESEYDFSLDIQDPFGMPKIVYERTAKDLYSALQKVVIKLKNQI
jgi:protein-tyrosine phosphatase